MLTWLKSVLGGTKKETHDAKVARIRALIGNVVPAYGEIMEKHPLVIFPTSKLPLPKEDMKIALQLAWTMTNDEKLQTFVSIAYGHLSQFRDDVQIPIDPTLPLDATPYETNQILAPFLAVAKKMEAERDELMAEFDEFRRLSLARAR